MLLTNEEWRPVMRVTEKASNGNGDWLQRAVECLAIEVDSRGRSGFAEWEKTALACGNEIVRRALEAQLQRIADAEGSTVQGNGATYRRHQPGRLTYHSLAGPLRIERWTYRQCGTHNGPIIVPLDQRAGLRERATPALSFAVARGYGCAPSRQLEADLHAAARRPPSRSTLERMGKKLGAHAASLLMPLESEVRARELVPNDAVAITMGLDRTTVPMAEPCDAHCKHEPTATHYRMAYVGTVALTTLDGELLRSWRYASPAFEGPALVIRRMLADVRRVLRRKPRASLAVVQDGAVELWNLMREALRRVRPDGTWLQAVDFYHATQHMHTALLECEEDARVRRRLFRTWKQHLLTCRTGIERIRRYFNLSAYRPDRETGWTERQQRTVDREMGGLFFADLFDYATLRERGHHVGSGVTEGACKSLIMLRAKRSGQRWTPKGIHAVLTLRSLVVNERIQPFWRKLLKDKYDLDPLPRDPSVTRTNRQPATGYRLPATNRRPP